MSELITKQDIEELLANQSRVILDAVDVRLKKMEDRTDGRFQTLEDQMDSFELKLDHLTTTLDNFLKRLTDWEDEFTLLKAEVDKIKLVLRDKLGVEISLQG